MDDQKISELSLNEGPFNNVVRVSQLPSKSMKLARPVNFSSVIEWEDEITPWGGDTDYYAGKTLIYKLRASDDRLRYLYGPATYHTCKVTINDATSAFDSTSNCFFRSLKLSGAGTLEEIDNCHILNNILLDCTVNAYDRKQYFSFLGGGNAYGCTGAQENWQQFSINNNNIRDGYIIEDGDDGYFCQLIPSGLVGAFADKMVVLSEIKEGLKLELKLETNALALVSAGGSYLLSECRLKMSIIELNDLLTESVRRIYDGIFIIPFTSWANETKNIITGNTGSTIEISTGLKYVKGIIACFRSDDIVSGANERSLSTRAKFHMIEYSWSVNGRKYPATNVIELVDDSELCNNGRFGWHVVAGPPAVNTGLGDADIFDSRSFFNVMKCFNNFASTHATCSFSMNEFLSTGMLGREGDDEVNISGKGAFLCAVSLELPNSEDEFRTTTNCQNNKISFKYKLASGLTQNIYCDFYIQHSADLLIEDKTANVDK